MKIQELEIFTFTHFLTIFPKHFIYVKTSLNVWVNKNFCYHFSEKFDVVNIFVRIITFVADQQNFNERTDKLGKLADQREADNIQELNQADCVGSGFEHCAQL